MTVFWVIHPIIPGIMTVFWVIHPITSYLEITPHCSCPTHDIQKEYCHYLTIMALHTIGFPRYPPPKTQYESAPTNCSPLIVIWSRADAHVFRTSPNCTSASHDLQQKSCHQVQYPESLFR